jgi:hypothetical protein
MGTRRGKIDKFAVAARAVKAISTLALVVVPVAALVGATAGYGMYSLIRRLRNPERPSEARLPMK